MSTFPPLGLRTTYINRSTIYDEAGCLYTVTVSERTSSADNPLSREDQFLLEEYKHSADLTKHMDDIKMRLTGFFLTFNGIVIAGLLVLLKGEAKVKVFDEPQTLIAILSLVIALLGIPVVRILASLRRVQIQRYRVMNNIRTQFLRRDDYDLWNAVELSERTLPIPNRKSGNYGWLLLVILISSSVFALSSYLFGVVVLSALSPTGGFLVSLVVFVTVIWAEDRYYFSHASPPDPPTYSAENPPTT